MRRPAVLQLSLYVPGPPALRRLATLLPTAWRSNDEMLVELADLTPEAVLSACLAAGCGVVGSRVIFPAHLSGSQVTSPSLHPGAPERVGALEMAHTDS
jgi:hypothetical protein